MKRNRVGRDNWNTEAELILSAEISETKQPTMITKFIGTDAFDGLKHFPGYIKYIYFQ